MLHVVGVESLNLTLDVHGHLGEFVQCGGRHGSASQNTTTVKLGLWFESKFALLAEGCLHITRDQRDE